MKIVGITGQVGSGKTMLTNSMKYEISQINKDMRIHAIEVDQFFKRIAINKPDVIALIHESLGSSCFKKDGSIDLAIFANFIDYGFDEYKNSILPTLNRHLIHEIESIRKYNYDLVLVDYNHLFHTSFYKKCNEFIYVKSDVDYIVDRLCNKRNIQPDRIMSIISNGHSYDYVKNKCKSIGCKLTLVDTNVVNDYSEFSKKFIQ